MKLDNSLNIQPGIKKSPNPALIRFGKYLKERRQSWGMSQATLARLSGTTQSTIAHIEAGQANPTIETLQGIAVGLRQELVITFRNRQK